MLIKGLNFILVAIKAILHAMVKLASPRSATIAFMITLKVTRMKFSPEMRMGYLTVLV